MFLVDHLADRPRIAFGVGLILVGSEFLALLKRHVPFAITLEGAGWLTAFFESPLDSRWAFRALAVDEFLGNFLSDNTFKLVRLDGSLRHIATGSGFPH